MKNFFKTLAFCFTIVYSNAQIMPLTFTVTSNTGQFNLTCINDTLILTANSNYTTSPVSYMWISSGNTITANSMYVTTPGTYTVAAITSGNQTTQTITISGTNPPLSSLSPSIQSITCSLSSVTTVTLSGVSSNLSHKIISPQGGVYTSNNSVVYYTPLGVGTYTHILMDDLTGCSTIKTFSYTSNQSLPTYSLMSPQNFTLGCGTKSVAVLNIVNANTFPPGGALSYTLIGAPTSTNVQPGLLSYNSSYTIGIAGTWTAIVRDNYSLCETRAPFTIIQNTFAPNINVSVPTQVLNCNIGHVVLHCSSNTPNTSANWSFPGAPGNIQADSIVINSSPSSPSATLIANYTLTITDNNNTCKSNTVIPMYQNLFPPQSLISSGGPAALSCETPSIMLTNISITNIPPATGFPTNQSVIGFLWEGPAPQTPLAFSSIYVGFTAGVYTLTAQDLNNGCKSTGTTVLSGGCNSVGIDKNTEASYSVKVFPNPTNGLIELSSENLNDNSTLEIYNLLGSLVKKQSAHSVATTVNISNELNGIYILHLKQNNKIVFTTKIVKE